MLEDRPLDQISITPSMTRNPNQTSILIPVSVMLGELGCRFGVTPVTSEIIKRNKKRDIFSLKFK